MTGRLRHPHLTSPANAGEVWNGYGMGYWGKIIGGMAGFAMGGPFGAVVGAALGHAADSGGMPNMGFSFGSQTMLEPGPGRRHAGAARPGVLDLRRGAGGQAGQMRRPGEAGGNRRVQAAVPHPAGGGARHRPAVRPGARQHEAGSNPTPTQLGEAFADNRGVLEDVLSALFVIARADGPVNGREQDFLARVHRAVRAGPGRLGPRARGSVPRPAADAPDPYAVLGVSRVRQRRGDPRDAGSS